MRAPNVDRGARDVFSTAGGNRWLLERGDGTAVPLARPGERLPPRVLEQEQRFVIEWTHDYRVRGELLVAVETLARRAQGVYGLSGGGSAG